ncbi:MAG: GAF domain-containing protein, partial [Thermoanaerobaculia bacterium]
MTDDGAAVDRQPTDSGAVEQPAGRAGSLFAQGRRVRPVTSQPLSPPFSAPGPELDELVRIAAFVCSTPTAFVAFPHEKGHWLEGRVGELLIVNDARADPRFADHPLVREGVRFYAGVPLITQGGRAVGTLCVADSVPRSLTDEQLHVLQALARQVVAQFELRHAAEELAGTAEQLRANQQKLSSIFGAMSDAVIFSEPGGRILEANPAAERMFACTNMELCALNLRDLYEPSDQRLPAAREEFDRTDAFRGELSVRRTGGEIFPAEVAVNRYVDANSQSRTAVVLRDVTERRRTEDALHFAKERYTELVDRINA